MAGVALHIKLGDLSVAQRFLDSIGRSQRGQLLEAIGADLESQTRHRISDQKTAPDGSAWAAWSPAYAKTRHSGHSLLENQGDLLDSIQYHLQSNTAVEVGSNLIYAAAQHAGYKGNPGRQYLGLSADNRADLHHLVNDFLAQHAEAIQ